MRIYSFIMTIIFGALLITRASYEMTILPFRFLSNGRYKNEKF
jgi:hypothetical protein